MSRSVRKKPIMGWTTCRSEKDDKRIWHRRWRAHQRSALASALQGDEDGALLVSINQISNVYDMGKDGRQYWPLAEQRKAARRYARGTGRGRKERKALELRFQHKLIGK